MFGALASLIARTASRARPRLALKPDSDSVKVNIGAGLCAAPGWIHVEGSVHALLSGAPPFVLRALHRSSNRMRDGLPADSYVHTLRTHKYVFYDVNRGLPFADATADFVYSSHVLEHFYQSDAERLVSEMFRILKPGGTVRVCIPDLEYAMRLYQEGRKAESLHYFFTPRSGDTYARHYYMYDFEMLSALLQRIGFSEITRRQYREGVTPDLDVLDNRPEETLYVEARKPA